MLTASAGFNRDTAKLLEAANRSISREPVHATSSVAILRRESDSTRGNKHKGNEGNFDGKVLQQTFNAEGYDRISWTVDSPGFRSKVRGG